jgi:hypothetical protein
MRGGNTCASGGTLDPLLQWFAKAIGGEVGQLSAAIIKDGPIWRFPSVKRLRTTTLVVSGYGEVGVRLGRKVYYFEFCGH